MKELEQLVGRLERAFADRLVSVILYGSAAANGQTDSLSDLNVLCVVKNITPSELALAEPVLQWWRQLGNPSPLLMSEQEVYSSADSFPIEFGDMKRNRKVLFGIDVIADMTVHPTHYRAYVERELRASLFRLRQQGAQALSAPASLLQVCVASVPTFLMLGRHALLLAGIEPRADRRHLAAQLGTIGVSTEPFEVLLNIREAKGEPDLGDMVAFFGRYLECIHTMVDFVNRLEEKR